jgi:hypothetical protein
MNGKSVWVEYPESVHVRATYDAGKDAFVLEDGTAVAAADVGRWGRRKPGDPHKPGEKKGAKQPNIVVRFIAGALQVIFDLF